MYVCYSSSKDLKKHKKKKTHERQLESVDVNSEDFLILSRHGFLPNPQRVVSMQMSHTEFQVSQCD